MIHKHRFMACIALILSFTIPLVCFFIYDQGSVQRRNNWDAKQNSDKIMTQYPIISSVYNNYYHNPNTNNDLQEIKLDHQVDPVILNTMQDFQNQLQILMKKDILKPSYLDVDAIQDYEVTFGTLINNDNKDGKQVLTQIYSMNGEDVNYSSCTMDKTTHKITGIFIENESLNKQSKDQQKYLLWQFIEYLGLDTLPDWHYTENGYESYKARIQVYMKTQKINGYHQMNILICPLGQYDKNQDNHRIIISG